MELSLNDFLIFTKTVDNLIIETKKKLDLYSQEEVKKRGGSNFVLELTEDEIKLPKKILGKFGNPKNIEIDDYVVNELYKYKEEYKQKVKDFNDFVDEKFKNIEDKPSEFADMLNFSSWIRSILICLDRISKKYSKELRLNELIGMEEVYENLKTAAKLKNEELTKLYTTATENTKNLEKELKEATENLKKSNIVVEQELANKNVLDIANYYAEYRESVNSGKNLYGWLYFGFSAVLIGLFCLIFLKLDKIFVNSESLYLKISKSIISCSLIGFATFIVNDFRKRHNICKQILDEIDQKIAIVKTYSSLLSRIDDFNEDIKKQYHQKVLQNIVDTLLMIRNHGFVSKSFQQSSPSITATATELVEQLSKLVSNK